MRLLIVILLFGVSAASFMNCSGFGAAHSLLNQGGLRSSSVFSNGPTGRVSVKVIQSSGDFFPPGQTPIVSWAQRDLLALNAPGSFWSMGTNGWDQREFTVELPAGQWFFGVPKIDGYNRMSYSLSTESSYIDVQEGGIPVNITPGADLGLTISYVKTHDDQFPANQRLSCEFQKEIGATDEQEVRGSSVGVRVGVNKDFASIGTKLELINPANGQSLQIIDSRSAAGAAWQATLGYSPLDRSRTFAPNQSAGNWFGQFGHAASLTDLRQTDWTPMWTDHQREIQPGDRAEGNSACFNLGARHFDGQNSRIMDLVTTPQGGKVVRTTYVNRFRARDNYAWRNWQTEQAMYMTRLAAVAGDLRTYFVGARRAWMSPELRPASKNFFSAADGHCVENYGVNGEYWNSMRSSCRTSALAYIIFRYSIGGRDIAMAIVNHDGKPFQAEIDSAKALTCRKGDPADPDPECGNLELHSLLSFIDNNGDRIDWANRQVNFQKGEILENRMHYLVGSPQELADLGFVFAGGPSPQNGQLPWPGSSASGAGSGAGWGASVSSPASQPAPAQAPAPAATPAPTPTPAPAPAVPRGWLNIVHSGKCVDVPNLSLGTVLLQWQCHNAPPAANQQWRFVHMGGGYYQIQSETTQGCLEVSSGGTSNGTPITYGFCGSSDIVLWRLERTGTDGSHQLRSKSSGKCLDVSAASFDNGARMQLWDCNAGQANQSFHLPSGL